MALFPQKARRSAELLARLAHSNPFDAEFIEIERLILGADHVPHGAVWSLEAGYRGNPALEKLASVAERVAQSGVSAVGYARAFGQVRMAVEEVVLGADAARWSIVLWRLKRQPTRPVPPVRIP